MNEGANRMQCGCEECDLIPLHRVFGVTADEAMTGQTGYLAASPDERCDRCGANPRNWLIDCGDDTLCIPCADREHPNGMIAVRTHIPNLDG